MSFRGNSNFFTLFLVYYGLTRVHKARNAKWMIVIFTEQEPLWCVLHCHTMACASDIAHEGSVAGYIYYRIIVVFYVIPFAIFHNRVTRTSLIPTCTGIFFKLVWYVVCTLVCKLMHTTVTKRMKCALLWEIAMIAVQVNKIWEFIVLSELHFHWDWCSYNYQIHLLWNHFVVLCYPQSIYIL